MISALFEIGDAFINNIFIIRNLPAQQESDVDLKPKYIQIVTSGGHEIAISNYKNYKIQPIVWSHQPVGLCPYKQVA